MNDPHVKNPANPDEEIFEVSPEFLDVMKLAFECWENSAGPEETGEQIKQIVITALNGDLDNELSHTDGPAVRQAMGHEPHTQGIADSRLESLRQDVQRRKQRSELEADGRALQGIPGYNITPRKMSRAELQAAADRLVGPRTHEDNVLEAIKQGRKRFFTNNKLTPEQLREDATRILSSR